MERSYRIGMPYVGDRFGGSNMSSMVMAKALQARGHKPFVITHGAGRVALEAEQLGLEVIEVQPLSHLPGYARADRARPEQLKPFWSCMSLIKDQKLDLVHTNDLTMLRTWALPTRVAGAHFIAHWRTAMTPSLSVAASLALSHKVISVSQYSKDVMPAWAKRKTVVEYNSLDTFFAAERRAEARAQIRQTLGLPQNAILVGVFANLIRRKRNHMLVDIIAGVTKSARGDPVFGLMCGGPAEPLDTLFAEKIERYGLQARILQPGFVRPSDVWMAACDIIIAPAEKEPLARNVLEALAIGIPVIVSSDGGLPEIVEDGITGLVLPPEDLPAWIKAVQGLLDHPQSAEALATAGQKSVERLTPACHAERIEDIYAQVLAKT